jgi:hypothetical protein
MNRAPQSAGVKVRPERGTGDGAILDRPYERGCDRKGVINSTNSFANRQRLAVRKLRVFTDVAIHSIRY